MTFKLMKIILLQTGGTIDKDYPKSINGRGFEIGNSALIDLLNKLPLSFDYQVDSILKKDSSEINTEDLLKIYKSCTSYKEDKIIITHGTDTILKTANYLSKIKNKTIVLTGSFLPYNFKNSDADFNIGMAVAGIQTLSHGIYVSLNGQIGKFNEFKRNEQNGRYFINT